MHYVDIIFLVVFGIFFLIGFKGGLLRGVITILSLIVGLILATRGMHKLGEIIVWLWDVHEVVGAVLGFVLIFIGIIIAQILLVAFLQRRSKPLGLNSRLGGAALGVLEGAIYLSLLVVFLNLYDVPSQRARNQSVLYKSLHNFAPQVFDAAHSIFPGTSTFQEELKKSFEKFRLGPED